MSTHKLPERLAEQLSRVLTLDARRAEALRPLGQHAVVDALLAEPRTHTSLSASDSYVAASVPAMRIPRRARKAEAGGTVDRGPSGGGGGCGVAGGR